MSSKLKKRRKASVCYNCGTQLLSNENYCPNCGQENNSKQASLRDLFDDFLGDYFVFDSRLFRSIVPLVASPGKITIEYLNGKRRRYIPPIRVFLFLSFLYFGLSYLTGIDFGSMDLSAGESEQVAKNVGDAFERNFNLVLFLYTPIFALLIRLFYKSEKRNFYVNFFVYSLHLFSLFFILGILQILLFMGFNLVLSSNAGEWGETIVRLSVLGYMIYYSIVSLKRVFQKKYSALRFLGVLVISLVAFLILLLATTLILLFIYAQ
ncbi:MAG: DUF3667 domain-containing protein [Crocinitomicaceae bacterium]